jgi:hypothetical protein
MLLTLIQSGYTAPQPPKRHPRATTPVGGEVAL